MSILAILAATAVWFVLAGILFFNPIVDKVYRKMDHLSGVRALPQNPQTIGMIFVAIFIQVILFAWVYSVIKTALPGSWLEKGLLFGLILIATKMIPRDVDRTLVSTYPRKRLLIELVIGCINCFAVGLILSYMM